MEKYLYNDLNLVEQTHWWHQAKRQVVQLLIKKYLPQRKLQIIDVGCGTGQTIKSLASFGQVWGIDSSKEAIKFCRAKNLTQVKQASSNQIPFKDKTFDLVLLLDVLEHVDEDKTLQEIKRILKPNQFLIITVPAFSWLWSRWDEVLHHKRRYSQRSLTQVLQKNGFKIEKLSFLYSFLVAPALLVRLIKSIRSKQGYQSDFAFSPKLINKILSGISKIEIKYALTFKIPFGTSIICLASNDEN